MPNIMDYIDWRGDLTFEKAELNLIDSLIFTVMSYTELDGVAPSLPDEYIKLSEISNRFFSIYSRKTLLKNKSFIKNAPFLMEKMAASKRFGELLIGNYVNCINENHDLQFSALEIQLPGDISYIAFRGTDDTIVGWKEDFNLSNGVVLAETFAKQYLERVCEGNSRRVFVGGHSKGGNLAVYAAVMCDKEIRDRIIAVYDNDGPGFWPEFFEEEGYIDVADRIQRVVPEASIIGMLLYHKRTPLRVQSSEKGILQHDGFSWQVMGREFIETDKTDLAASIMNQSLAKWIFSIEPESRDDFIKDVFDVLYAPGAKTLTEVQDGGILSLIKMFERMRNLSPDTKKEIDSLKKIVLTEASGEVVNDMVSKAVTKAVKKRATKKSVRLVSQKQTPGEIKG